MITQDARSLLAAAKEEKRKQAVRMLKNGYEHQDIADTFGIHCQTVSKWLIAYIKGRFSQHKSPTQGQPAGSGEGVQYAA